MSQTLFNSIVSIHDSKFKSTFGTGFLVSSEYIITCHHVIESIITSENKVTSNSEFIGVKFVNNNHKYLVELIDFVPLVRKETVQIEVSDIAILRIESLEEEDRNNFAPLSLRYIDGIEFKSFGFSIDRKDIVVENDIGKWIEGKAVNEVANGWVQLNLNNILDDVKEGFSGAPIWDKKEGGVIGIMTISMSPELQAYMMPITLILDKWSNLLSAIKKQNPYKGLEHFGVEDKENFFGREEESVEIAKSLIDSKLYMLYGASGSGKSSLIFAGIIPILNQNKEIEIITFRPSFQIFENLVSAFIDLYSKEEGLDKIKEKESIINSLKINEIKLSSIISDIFKKSSFTHLIIIIDQFEELFTLNDDKKLQDNFLNHLLNVINSDNKVSILISMRIDFLDNLLENKPFTDLLNQNKDKKLGAIDKKLIKDVIEKPAKRYHVTFENGLVDKLIEEFNESNLQLPLMEFALQKIWDKMESRTITHKSLDKLGGVKGALTNYADSVLEKLLKDKSHIKNIFMKLITPSDKDYNRKVEVLSSFKEKEIEYQVLMKLARSRLINIEEETVEITHEVLIRKWKTLRKWIKENEEFLIWKKSIEISRNEYESGKGDLLVGVKLFEAKEYVRKYERVLSISDKDYINESIEKWKKERKELWLKRIFIVLLIFLFGVYVWRESQEKKEKTINKLIQEGLNYLDKKEQTKAKHLLANVISESIDEDQVLIASVILKNIPDIKLTNIISNVGDIEYFKINEYVNLKIYKYNKLDEIEVSIEINDNNKKEEFKEISYNDKNIFFKSAVFNTKKTKLLMLDNSNIIKLMDVKSGKIESVKKVSESIYNISFSNNDSEIIGFGKKISLIDLNKKNEEFSCEVNIPNYLDNENSIEIDNRIFNNQLIYYNSENITMLNLKDCSQINANIKNEKAFFLSEEDKTLILWENKSNIGIYDILKGQVFNLKNSECEFYLTKINYYEIYTTEYCVNSTNIYIWNYLKWNFSNFFSPDNIQNLKNNEIMLNQKAIIRNILSNENYLLTIVGQTITLRSKKYYNDYDEENISENIFDEFFSFNHAASRVKFIDKESIVTYGKDIRNWKIEKSFDTFIIDNNIEIPSEDKESNSSYKITYEMYKDNIRIYNNKSNKEKTVLINTILDVKLSKSENTLIVFSLSPSGSILHTLVDVKGENPKIVSKFERPIDSYLIVSGIDKLYTTVLFGNNDRILFIPSISNNKIGIWDMQTGKKLGTLKTTLNFKVIEQLMLTNDYKILIKTDDGETLYYSLIDEKIFSLKKCYPLKIQVETGTLLDEDGNIKELSRNEWQEKKKKYEEVLRTKNDDLCK